MFRLLLCVSKCGQDRQRRRGLLERSCLFFVRHRVARSGLFLSHSRSVCDCVCVCVHGGLSVLDSVSPVSCKRQQETG